tara:strand:+ start:140 stop:514 length:375 start_codon:yes stop_codon:yes gene_type:complete
MKAVKNLLGKAVGTKEKPASPWTGALYVFLALIAVALAALPAILARRKAAKLAHQVDTLKEEKNQAELKALDENFESQAKHYVAEAARLGQEISEIDKQLEVHKDARDEFSVSLDAITDWGDLK